MTINKQSYLAELEKLLGFMSTWDRKAAIEKYSALFDEAGDEAALIKMLGTPTRLAISLAGSYVPTPMPAPAIEERDPILAEFEGEKPAETVPAGETVSEEPVQTQPRRVRPFGLIAAILFGLVIGLPVAIVLICLGIPFLVLGCGVIFGAVWSVFEVIGLLAMFSDILVIAGAGLILTALGLFTAWFGLWLSLALGQLWIGGAVLRLCRALSFKKEVAAQ